MMRGWKMLCQRNGVHLTDIASFPFFEPAKAPDPITARKALDRTVGRMTELSRLDEIDQSQYYEESREAFDDDVFDFFSLSDSERALVRETVDLLMPSIRPRSFNNLDTPAQRDCATRSLRDVWKGTGPCAYPMA